MQNGLRAILRVLVLTSLLAAWDVGAAERTPLPEGRRFELALRAFDLKRFDESRRLLEDLLTADPSRGLYWFNLGNACIKLKDYTAASAAYRKVIDVSSPLATPAGLYVAKAARAQGNLEGAATWVSWAAERNPPANLARAIQEETITIQEEAMRQGLQAYQDGAYPRALQLFALAAAPGPGSWGDAQLKSQATMMKALALLRSDHAERALDEFDKLAQEGSAAQGLRETAWAFGRLERNARGRNAPAWVFGGLAVGYNSNVYGEGGDSPLGRPIVPWAFGVGLRLKERGNFSFRVGDTLDGEEVVALPSSRFLRNSFWGELRFQSPKWLVLIASQFELSFLGLEPFLGRPGVSFAAQRVLGEARLGLALAAGFSFPASRTYDYLRGAYGSARLTWLRLNGAWSYGVFVASNREIQGALPLTTGTVPLAYTGVEPGLMAFWNPSLNWELSGTASHQWRKYSDTSLPSEMARDDRVLGAQGRISFVQNRQLVPYAEASLSVNSSTMGPDAVEDKNYRRFVVVTGVSWDLL